MKGIFITVALFSIQSAFTQPAEVTQEANGTKIIKGFLTKQELTTDSAFVWFLKNQENIAPDPTALQVFRENKDSIHILAFVGTWCGDTKNILPKFFRLTDAAGFPQERITMLGVDRQKKTLHHLSEALGVTNVPTFIIMKNGKEIGRVVEYGRYGMVDKELGEIISAAKR